MYRELYKNPKTGRIRDKIDEAMDLGPIGMVDELPDCITLLEEAHEGRNCEEFALGRKGIMSLLSIEFPSIDDPQAGDIVLYYNQRDGYVHIGVLQEDGTVTSKWGKGGPVLNHPWDHVPTRYGETITYRRVSKEDVKDLIPWTGKLEIE